MKFIRENSILKIFLSFCVLFFVGCSIVARDRLDSLYGKENTITREGSLTPEQIKSWNKTKVILDKRCAVCHSCYDAPCQLKLTSAEGIVRGATKAKVYDHARLRQADPTRLHIDETDVFGWRKKDFYSVLNERDSSIDANKQSSVLYRLLLLKEKNPLPQEKLLHKDIEVGLNRSEKCPKIEEMDSYEKEHPQWGMPFGLPQIPEHEQTILKNWIESGALVADEKELPENIKKQVQVWEDFFNKKSLKAQLVNRYIYEHIFLADLYFDNLDKNITFKLVRSYTPSGTEISPINTRRPYGDPGKEFYYRLMQNKDSLVLKTHVPYALNPKRMERYKELFFIPKYKVTSLPGYSGGTSSNPFINFKDIPAKSRYKFMLDEAQFIVMGFIKGPVCNGNTALNVINDRYWIFFTDPDKDPFVRDEKFLSDKAELLQLPIQELSNVALLAGWPNYKKKHSELMQAKNSQAKKVLGGFNKIDLSYIWDGDGKNSNAGLTVFRHYDSASVDKGLIGNFPKTAWVMDYTLLERVHYLLAVGFDVFGNIGHQLIIRLYMDFLRTEGENNFLALLPVKKRIELQKFWYRGIKDEEDIRKEEKNNPFLTEDSGIKFKTEEQKEELFTIIEKKLNVVKQDLPLGDPNTALKTLASLSGEYVSYLPESSLLDVVYPNGNHKIYSILIDRGYTNVSMIYLEDSRRRPAEDEITLVPGFIGAYPNAFFRVNEADLPEFTSLISQLKSEKDYIALKDRFAVRRTSADFWKTSDFYQNQLKNSSLNNMQILDYSRLEDR